MHEDMTMNDIDYDDPVGAIDVDKYIDIVSYAGKFEGEPPWVPYFYDKLLLGGFVEWTEDTHTGECWDIIAVEEDEKKAFEDYALEYNYVLLYQTADGFIIGSQHRTIEEARACMPELDEPEEDSFENDAENNEQTNTRSYDASEEA